MKKGRGLMTASFVFPIFFLLKRDIVVLLEGPDFSFVL